MPCLYGWHAFLGRRKPLQQDLTTRNRLNLSWEDFKLFRNHSGPQTLQRHGGAKGSRTPDLLNAIQALYQLSYGPDPVRMRAHHRYLRRR
jgi:hypothetical protein